MSNLVEFPALQTLARGNNLTIQSRIAFDAANWLSRTIMLVAALALLVATAGIFYANFSRGDHRRVRLISILLFIAGLVAVVMSTFLWSSSVID